MTDGLLTYHLHEDIVAFTTDRTIGRDPDKVRHAVCQQFQPTADGAGTCPEDELRFARPHQTHTDRIMLIAEEYFSLTPQSQQLLMEGIDAVMTNLPRVILGVSTADCIPILVYDPQHHAAAAIHAGWRGTVQRIVQKTLAQMACCYHTDLALCRAQIGPGISMDSFEVGDEVYEAFAQAGFDMTAIATRYPLSTAEATTPQRPWKWHIDLKEANRHQLLAAGLPADSIAVSPIDTFTDTRFFSARREQKGDIKCGRIFSGFVMR